MEDVRFSDLKSDLSGLGGKIDRIASVVDRTAANQDNLKDYIAAVSVNVKEARKEAKADVEKIQTDINEHKVDLDAHGVGATNRSGNMTIAWVGIGLAVMQALFHFGPMLFAGGGNPR